MMLCAKQWRLHTGRAPARDGFPGELMGRAVENRGSVFGMASGLETGSLKIIIRCANGKTKGRARAWPALCQRIKQ